MDLGFGNSNQVMGNAAAKLILESTRAQEQAVESNMAHYDSLLEANDDTLEALRERRLAQLKQLQKKQAEWRSLGHGSYTELVGGGRQDSRDVARGFFETTKTSTRVVVHFYRPTTPHCDVFHAHLSKLATRHLETRFIKVNVEGCDEDGGGGGASWLVEKLGIVVMPTLVVIKDRKAVHHVRGFDELGGTTEFSTNALARLIGDHDGLIKREEEEEEEEAPLKENSHSINSIRISRGRKGVRDGMHDGEFDE